MNWKKYAVSFSPGTVVVLCAAFLGAFGLTLAVAQGKALGGGMDGAPFWARSAADATAHGHKNYAQRPGDVQRVMQLMYASAMHYRSFVGLFVSHIPMARDGSVRINIVQPDAVRAAAYGGVEGVGLPDEIMLGEGDKTYLYAPASNTYTVLSRPTNSTLPPLDTVPISVAVPEVGGTTIFGSALDGGKALWADMLIHPSALITSSLFQAMDFAEVGRRTVDGRSAWELDGELVSNADPLDGAGPGFRVDGMKLWVDTQTGIVLRLEFETGSRSLGWAELQRVNIDGSGAQPDGTDSGIARWSLPADAKLVQSYRDFVATNIPNPSAQR